MLWQQLQQRFVSQLNFHVSFFFMCCLFVSFSFSLFWEKREIVVGREGFFFPLFVGWFFHRYHYSTVCISFFITFLHWDDQVEGGWILDGQKRWIGNSTFADVLVIFARNTTTNQINGYVKHNYDGAFFLEVGFVMAAVGHAQQSTFDKSVF